MIREKSFYKTLVRIAVPLVVYELISFCVQMLDTVMCGVLGDYAVSAVTVAGQPYFIFIVLVFGLTSGGSVIISQYYGKRDFAAIRKTMSVMFVTVLFSCLLFMLLCFVFPAQIMSIFAKDAFLISEGVRYLRIVVFSYLLSGICRCYTAALNAKGNTTAGAVISVMAFLVNMAANYILIYGKLGMPAMGVAGAAGGTVAARLFELAAVWIYFSKYEKEIGFTFRDLLHIDRSLIPGYLKISTPIILDDLVWALGSSTQVAVIGNMNAAYVTSAGVSSVASQAAMVFIYGISRASSIVIGQIIGEGRIEYAKKAGKTFLAIALCTGIFASLFVLAVRNPVLAIYPNISDSSRELAFRLIGVTAVIMLACGMENTCVIGVLRGAGDTEFAFKADAGCMWLIGIPAGMIGAFLLHLDVTAVYFLLRADVFVKISICTVRILKGNYIRDLTASAQSGISAAD